MVQSFLLLISVQRTFGLFFIWKFIFVKNAEQQNHFKMNNLEQQSTFFCYHLEHIFFTFQRSFGDKHIKVYEVIQHPFP